MKYKCRTCSVEGKENFYSSAKYQCKKCWNKRTYQSAKDKLIRLIEEYGGKCTRCGYDKCFDALEFHHRDPEAKEFTIGHRRGLKEETLRKEVEKCDIVCRNCHAEIHAELRGKT
jgi:hypothetical protein